MRVTMSHKQDTSLPAKQPHKVSVSLDTSSPYGDPYRSAANAETETGVPIPEKYNRHFVNRYSRPNALNHTKKPEKLRRLVEHEVVLGGDQF